MLEQSQTNGFGLHNYESAFKAIPPRRGGSTFPDIAADPPRIRSNYYRKSAFIPLLAFIEQTALANIVDSGYTSGSNVFPPAGPAGWYGGGYTPWGTQVSTYLCPSDLTPRIQAGQNGRNSYAFSLGDTMMSHNSNTVDMRGAFSATFFRRGFRDFTDGLSNTIGVSERVWSTNFGLRQTGTDEIRMGTAVVPTVSTNPGTCLAAAVGRYYSASVQVKGRFGALYSDGQAERVGFNTILGPNKPSCVNDANVNADSNGGVLNASSYHTGGVNAVLMDGSVRFISDSIDTGNTAAAPVTSGPSPYGVWGAMGSISGGETVSVND